MIALWTALAWGQDFESCRAEERLSGIAVEEARLAVELGFREPDEGDRVLTALIDRHPACGPLYRARASVRHARGRDGEAEVDLRQAFALGDTQALRALAVHLHHRQGAGPLLDEAVTAFPGDAELKILQADERPVSVRYTWLAHAHDVHPDHAAVVSAYLDALAEAGRPWEAIEVGRAWMVDHEDAEVEAQVAALEAPFVDQESFRPVPGEFRLLEDGTEEVVVYSPERARLELEKRLMELGWTDARPFRGGTRYRSEQPVQPFVDLYDDGQVVVQTWGYVQSRALPDPSQHMIPLISARKLRHKRVRMMEDIAPQVWRWQNAIVRQAFTEKLDVTLPDQIAALWSEGIALEDGSVHSSLTERRDALVVHWQSRACNREGDAVREVISRFLRNVVQESEVALDEAGLAEADAGSLCSGRRLLGGSLGIPVE